MGWEYTTADKLLRHKDQFRLRLAKPKSGELPSGCLGDWKSYSSGGQADINDKWKYRDIEFQFPPKITTDGRRGNWDENELPAGFEPIAVFVSSGPREINLTWSYIIDSFDDNNSEAWSIARVTRNIRTLRGYFALAQDRDTARDTLVVEFYAWCIGGMTPMTARIKTIDVKYGETMVMPPGNKMNGAFPLRTDISVDLRIWTKGMMSDHGLARKSDLPIINLETLQAFEPPSWY